MRDTLNLRALKHSSTPKHRKIYDKAHRIMKEGFFTAELLEHEIMEIASKYPSIKAKVLFNGDIIITSKRDTWFVRDEVRFLTLYHRGSIINKGRRKEHYHIQDVFYDLDFLIASIVSHDDHALGIASRNMNEVSELVAKCSRIYQMGNIEESYAC